MRKFITKDMKWENMFLEMSIESDVPDAKFMFYQLGKRIYHVPASDVERVDNGYQLKINIAAAGGRGFLPEGAWVLVAEGSGRQYDVRVTFDLAYKFQDLSRVFRYAEDKAYVLTFEPSSENGRDDWILGGGDDTAQPGAYSLKAVASAAADKNICFTLHSSFMKKDPDWQDKASGIRNTIYKTLNKASENEHAPGLNHVLFMTETRDEIGGNLKAVYDEVMRRCLDRDYQITVYARNDVKKGLGVNGLIRLRKLIADQDIIFVDDFCPVFTYLDPPEGSRLVQLWHAVVGFKSVGYSRFGKTGSPHPAWSCHRKYTDVFIPHEDLKDVYREVIGIEKDAFKVVGSPRLDGFLDEDKVAETTERLYDKYPFIKDKRVILFAPTYRGGGEKDAFYDESMLDFSKIAEICGDDTVFLIKMHPFIDKKVDIPEEYRDVIYDVSDYSDINELYYISDILITDYSSDYFEFALLKKPILFYTYDRDRYQLLRGVHQDVKKSAPGKVCDTFSELTEALKSGDFDIEKTKRFADVYGPVLEQSASAAVVDEVFGKGQTVE